jgi:heterodisulfide reductase subunit B
MIRQAVARYAYFPGCSLVATNRAYDISTRNVARVLGIELQELDDWNCCGATAYMAIREKRSYVLSARNLAIAEKQGDQLATVCNACYVVLRKTNEHLAAYPGLREEVTRALQAGGMRYEGTVCVRHFLDILVNDVGQEMVRRHIQRDASRLRVACYSGCQLSRPFQDLDHPEYPELMERLCGWLGAQVVPFPLAAKCCGGMSMTTRPEIGRMLSGKILRLARQRGADCVVTACPLCQINLEAYQGKLSEVLKADCHVPVLYFTQLVGAAFGLGARELAIDDSLTPVAELLAAKVVRR